MHVCPECGEMFAEGGFCTRDGTRLAAGDDPLLGQSIASYRVARLIGVGGMGRVYKAVNPAIGSRVAIKVLSRDCAESAELVERFFAEARAVNLIRHESIVNVLDLSQLPDRRPYIVMEYLDGAPLSKLIGDRGPLPLGSLARLVGEVLGALGAAHAKGIVHRDLKPDNIFVTPHGRAKVLDFGIAKLQPEQSGRSGPTRDGSLMGTPHYMSPEQAQAHPVDARTDLYAVGVILYEGSTGRTPFHADSLFELLRKQIEEPPPDPLGLRPDMPPAYRQVIARALQKDPAARHESAAALLAELTEATRALPEGAWAPLGEAESQLTVGMSRLPTPAATPPISRPGATPGAAAQPASPTPSAVGQAMPLPAAAPRSRAPLAIVGALALLAAAALVVALALGGDSSPEVAAGAPGDAGRAAAVPPDAPEATAPIAADAAAPPVLAAAATAVDAATATAPPAETPPPAETAPPAEANDGADHPAPLPAGARGSRPNRRGDRFDVSGFVPEARAIARRVFSDAVLVRIDAGGVRPDGTADLTLDSTFSVTYRFASPSRARRPKDLPLGVEHKPTCLYYVIVSAREIDYYPLPGWKCDMAFIGAPRCRAAAVWKKAAKKGAPTRNAVATIGYWADPRGRGRWSFSIGRAFSRWIGDDC